MDDTVHKEKYSHTVLKIPAGINGFTLIELLIAMVVALVILGSTYGIFISQNKEISNQDKIVELQQNVRAAMDMMSREVRMAGYNPKRVITTPPIGIPDKDATYLYFIADLNESGLLGYLDECVYYNYDSSSLSIKRAASDSTGSVPNPASCSSVPSSGSVAWRSFADNITAFTFQYLAGNGGTPSTANDIRQVRLTITGRTSSPINGSYRYYTLTSDVHLRNLAFK